MVLIDKDLGANDDDECDYATNYKDSARAQLLQASEERIVCTRMT